MKSKHQGESRNSELPLRRRRGSKSRKFILSFSNKDALSAIGLSGGLIVEKSDARGSKIDPGRGKPSI